MDDRPFYYRVRGRTIGPVVLRQIRQLAQRAQIGRTTDVSRDGLQWGKAGDFPEIFDGGGSPPPPAEGGDPFGDNLSIDAGAQGVAVPSSNGGSWYYTSGGNQQGPVDLATLRQLVANGQVSQSEYVIPEGGTEWMTIQSVPQLAGGGGSHGGSTPIINVNVPSQSRGGGDGGDTNGLAIAGFILSLTCCLSWLGFILSLVALNGKNRNQRGLAIAGAIIGGILTLLQCLYGVLHVIVIAANAR